MKFPDKIKFKIVDKDSKDPVQDVAVALILYAQKKNNYYVGPKISNSDGEFCFTADDCREQIKISQEMYIMDYQSNLDDCQPKVSIEILPPENIKFIMDNLEKNKDMWQKKSFYDDNYISSLKTVKNSQAKNIIIDYQEADLYKSDTLQIEV